MRLIIIFLLFWSFPCSILCGQETAEELPITSKTVFKDENGNLISFESFIELTSGSGYVIQPTIEDGVLTSLAVVKSALAPATTNTNEFGSPVELIDRAPPAFEATDLQGNYYNSGDLQGKVVVLKFWFIACKPCIEEMPKLNSLVSKYKNGEVLFLAPALNSPEELNRFLLTRAFDYQILPDAKEFAHSFNVLGYPTHVVINRIGKVEAVYMGVNNQIEEKLSQAIERGLRREPLSVATTDSLVEEKEVEEEVQVNPNSIIKDETGAIVAFPKFVSMMNTQAYELLNKKDEAGQRYILIRKMEREEKKP